MKSKISRWLKVIAYNIVVVLLIFSGMEWYVTSCLNDPADCPEWLKPALREYYHSYDMNIIQMQPGMAGYDSALFYELKPGTFTYSNREFSNEYFINSAGFRDDEASLDHPKVVVLGDSYAMGWGVEQEETFPQLLEAELEYPVLNTGVSSYGTAREVASLAKVNTDSLEYLIIQYCPNDLAENKHFVLANHSLHVSTPENYATHSSNHLDQTSYYFLKHVITLLGMMGATEAPPQVDSAIAGIGDAHAFVSILQASPHIPKDCKIILFSLDAGKCDSGFISLIKNHLALEFASSLHDRMSYLDLTGAITSDHRYILDAHLNSNGHQLVATKLVEHMAELDFFTGVREWYYDDGTVSISCAYKNGLKNGMFKTFWPNGFVSRLSTYENGSENGWRVSYDSLGVTIDSVFYRADAMQP